MRAWALIFLKDCVEMAPLIVLALVLGAGRGFSQPWHGFVLFPATNEIVLAAGIAGIWQGVLDRRLRANAFLLHRPVRDHVWISARSAAGWFIATLPFVALAASRAIGRWWDPASEPEPLYQLEFTAAALDRAAWMSQVDAYVACLVAWAVLRATVSHARRVAAAVFTVLVPAALWILINFQSGTFSLLSIAVLLLAIAFSAVTFRPAAPGGVR